MQDTTHSSTVRRLRRFLPVVGLCLLVVCSMAPAAAQFGDPGTQTSFTDDFEDQNTDGWQGGNPQAVQQGSDGNWSLYVEDGFEGQTAWQDGPVLDLGEEFRVNGTVRSTAAQTFAPSRPRRLGLFESFGQGVMLLFHSDQQATYLTDDFGEDPANASDVIDDNFDNEWVRFVIESEGDGTVRAKVWQAGTAEPSSFQLTSEFDAASGQFAIEPGNSDDVREYYLDDVTITGQQAVSENLTIETGQLLQHGERQPYEVVLETESGAEDVTDEVTVESLNTSGLTVDEQTNELVATSDTAFNDRVTVRAEHPNVSGVAMTEVAVTTPEVENLEVLPPVWRITSFLGDWTTFLLLISIGAGIIGTRFATSFLGLAMMEIVLIIGWFGGYLSRGLMVISVFAALFIGLNLVANIDYQVQR